LVLHTKIIKKNFLKDYELAGSNEYDDWQDSPLGSLALVILFDQFSRNMFRDEIDPIQAKLKLFRLLEN